MVGAAVMEVDKRMRGYTLCTHHIMAGTVSLTVASGCVFNICGGSRGRVECEIVIGRRRGHGRRFVDARGARVW